MAPCKAEPDEAYGFLWCSSGGAGDAGDGDAPVCVGVEQGACGHGLRYGLADCAVGVDEGGGDADAFVFGGIGVGDKAAFEPLAGAWDVCAQGGNEAACA